MSISGDPSDPNILVYVISSSTSPVITSFYYTNSINTVVNGYTTMELNFLTEYSDLYPVDVLSRIMSLYDFPWQLSWSSLIDARTGNSILTFSVNTTKAINSTFGVTNRNFSMSLTGMLSSSPMEWQGRALNPTTLEMTMTMDNFPYMSNTGRMAFMNWFTGEETILVNASRIQIGVSGYAFDYDVRFPNVSAARYIPGWYILPLSSVPLVRNVTCGARLSFNLFERTPKVTNATAMDPLRTSPAFNAFLEASNVNLTTRPSRGDFSYRSNSRIQGVNDYLELTNSLWYETYYLQYRTSSSATFMGRLVMSGLVFTNSTGSRFLFQFDWGRYPDNVLNMIPQVYTDPITGAHIHEFVFTKTYSYYNETNQQYSTVHKVTVNITTYLVSAPCTFRGMALRPSQVKFVMNNSPVRSDLVGANSNITYNFLMGGTRLRNITSNQLILNGTRIDWGNATSGSQSVSIASALSLRLSTFMADVNPYALTFPTLNGPSRFELNFNLNYSHLLSPSGFDAAKNAWNLVPPTSSASIRETSTGKETRTCSLV
jgi:hypothetical protein